MAAIVSALTLRGAAIRVVSEPGLSIGELRTLVELHLSLTGLISQLGRAGVDPPLHPVLEWCGSQLLGGGEFAIRLPALLAGIGVIPAVAWLARELFDRRTAVVAALLACVAPLLVAYSQSASGYELVALFGTLSLIGAVRAARRGAPGDWALHAVAASALVWSSWATVEAATGRATPVSGAASMSGPGLFSYDAPRTLVRFALDPARAGRAVAARAWSVFSNTAPKNIVVEHQLSGATIGGFVHAPVTLAGAAAAARAVGDPSATAALLGEAQPAQVPPRRGPRSRGRLRRGEGPRPWGGRLRACLHAYARKPASNALGSAAIAC